MKEEIKFGNSMGAYLTRDFPIHTSISLCYFAIFGLNDQIATLIKIIFAPIIILIFINFLLFMFRLSVYPIIFYKDSIVLRTLLRKHTIKILDIKNVDYTTTGSKGHTLFDGNIKVRLNNDKKIIVKYIKNTDKIYYLIIKKQNILKTRK